MSYKFYLDGILLPITPGSVKIKYGNRLKKIELVSGDEIIIGRARAVSEIAFSAVLPQSKYPFANYAGNFKKGDVILGDIIKLKDKGKPFRFIITRKTGGKKLFSTNINAVFAELCVKEDASDGNDIRVDIKLAEYRDYAVKKVKAVSGSAGVKKPPVRSAVPASSGSAKTHKVVKGDCLWMLAQTYLGNGNRYKELYNLNKAVIDAGNKGTGNPVYTIYPGQVLTVNS